MEERPKLKSCGVLVVDGDPVRRVLLMQHKNRLDLPKGHTEPGETELETALRELEEETGITAAQVEFDESFRFTIEYPVRKKKTGQWFDKTVVIFLARLQEEVTIRVTEHPGFTWLPWNPPHSLQLETIDPLLSALESHLR